MPNLKLFLWGVALGGIALLNILDVLPDWATIAAVLTLPFIACGAGMRCARVKRTGA